MAEPEIKAATTAANEGAEVADAAGQGAPAAAGTGHGAGTGRRGPEAWRVVIGILAALVIAFCAWSMSEYVGGRDPLAFLGTGGGEAGTEADAGTSAEDLSTSTAPTGRDDSLSADSLADGGSSDEGGPGERGASDGAAGGSSDQDGTAGTGSGSAGGSSRPVSGSAGGGSGTSSGSGSGGSTGTSGEDGASTRAGISVSVSINGSGYSVTLAQGSTALDALLATGASVEVGSNPYGSGSWVYAINGLGQDASHGWTYAVNGSMPNVMSDQYVVSDGDSVSWNYVSA